MVGSKIASKRRNGHGRTRKTFNDETPLKTENLAVTVRELKMIRRIRELRSKNHKFVLIQFGEDGPYCREVGKMET